jgi:hypothetical protein
MDALPSGRMLGQKMQGLVAFSQVRPFERLVVGETEGDGTSAGTLKVELNSMKLVGLLGYRRGKAEGNRTEVGPEPGVSQGNRAPTLAGTGDGSVL